MFQSPSQFVVASVNVLSNVIVDATISCRLFVFIQLRAKVSAGFTKESDMAVAAFDLVHNVYNVYCSLLSVL